MARTTFVTLYGSLLSACDQGAAGAHPFSVEGLCAGPNGTCASRAPIRLCSAHRPCPLELIKLEARETAAIGESSTHIHPPSPPLAHLAHAHQLGVISEHFLL